MVVAPRLRLGMAGQVTVPPLSVPGVDPSVAHLRAAVELLQKQEKHDDAGRCAFYALQKLMLPAPVVDELLNSRFG